MKTVIVGGSKILLAFMLIAMCAIGGVLAWLKFGIRPFDRLNAQTMALADSDPDKALAQYAKVFEAADEAKISVQDRSKLYLEYGRLLANHGKVQEGIEASTKSMNLSRSSWRGITEAAAISEIAESRLKLWPERKITQNDVKELMIAADIHPGRTEEGDVWFWPMYDEDLGRMQMYLGDYAGALASLEKSVERFKTIPNSLWGLEAAQGYYLEALVRQGKYAEANKKFVEYYTSLPADADKTKLQARYRQALEAADNKDPGYFERMKELLRQKKFVELDQAIGSLQKDKTVFAEGNPVRGLFYAALESLNKEDFDSVWMERIGLAREWVKANPKSAPAKIVLARLLSSYAWKARGGGWANNVSENGWKVFGERLAECKAVLDQVKDRPAEWYTAMQRCALGQGWDKKDYDAMVNEGLKRYPDYDSIVFLKCYWLQPRWNGQEGEFEKYLATVADKRGGGAGDALYARACWYLDASTIHNVLGQTSASWPRVKSGLEYIIKTNPQSFLAKGMLSILAVEVNDLKTAAGAFNTPQNNGK